METNVIYKGDCLELMKNITDKSIDMILCDLPFGTTKNKWDCQISFSELWDQYKRIIKDNGVICLFAQTPFDKILGASNVDMLRYEWIWEKDNATGFLNSKKMPLKIHENILVFYKKLPIYHPQMRTGFKPYKCKQGRHSSNYGAYEEGHITESNGERYPIDVIKFAKESGLHPTQKPTALLEYLIKTYTDKGDIVLDNCMGSGSTCIAAINTEREYIGMEMNDEYFSIAENRISQHILNKEKGE